MNVLDLFSGIGGFSLGLERAGMRTVAFCEIEPFCRAVLRKHWPSVPIFEDVRSLHAAALPAAVDVICGGFPCQDISLAGKGAGLDGERSGLWFEYLRLIDECRPRWAIIENVAALRARGFDTVAHGLEGIGYACTPFVVRASDIGAPHQRARVWIVAHPNSQGEHARALDAEVAGASQLVADAGREIGGRQARDAVCGTGAETVRSGQEESGRCGEALADSNIVARHEGRTSDAAQEQGRRDADRSSVSANGLADADIARLEERQQGDAGQCPTTERGSWWEFEPDVCRMVDGIPEGLHDAGARMGTESSAGEKFEISLRTVRLRVGPWLASHGRKSQQQRARELGNALRIVSHQTPLGERETTLAQALCFVHGLQEACETLGVVRDASQSLLEAWLALSEENQEWAVICACGGSWVSEWPNVGRVAHGVPERVDRLRALGNAVVPQIPEIIGRAIMSAHT